MNWGWSSTAGKVSSQKQDEDLGGNGWFFNNGSDAYTTDIKNFGIDCSLNCWS